MANNYNTGDTVVETSSTADNTWADGVDLAVGSTTGSKIATATTQKLGFFNATPVVQQSSTTDIKDALVALGFLASGGASPLDLDTGTLAAGTVNVSVAYQVGSNTAINASRNVFLTSIRDAGGNTHCTSSSTALTWTDSRDLAFGTSTGTKIGTGTTQKLGFWNATPVVQPASASQAAVATTAATNVTPYGYSQAQADGIVALLNEIRLVLVTVGLMKGSA